MKKFNRKLIKGTNWALAGLTSLLGFSSCEENGWGIEEYGPMEYGTPYAEFVISGKVTDADGHGLPGIRVVVPDVDFHQRATSTFIPNQSVITWEVRDTSYTKENGFFEYRHTGTPGNDSINFHLKFEDASENARFEADSAKVTFFGSDLKGGNGWYEGKAEKKISIVLKDRKNEE